MSECGVIYEQAQDGARGAYIPDFPGVVALGITREETAGRIHEALVAGPGSIPRTLVLKKVHANGGL